MLAPLQVRRLPIQLVAVLLALIVALLLGAALGYNLKTPSAAGGSTRVVVVHDSPSSSSPNDYSCIVVNGHKAC